MSDESAVSPNVAPGELELVRRFVNSLDVEDGVDQFESASSLEGWLRERELIEPGDTIKEEERSRAIAFREGLRDLMLVHHGLPLRDGTIDGLNEALGGANLRPEFRGDALLLRPGSACQGIDGVMARLVAIIHRAMIDDRWSRLKVCPADDCQWAFYDHSKNRSGKWCSMAVCGNRAKARSFRQRSGTEA